MPLDRTRIETFALATSLGVLLAAAVFLSLTAPVGTGTPTELALVSADGTATGYPTLVEPGERASTMVQITNNDRRERTYTVRASYDGTTLRTRTVTVAGDANRTLPLSFTAAEEPGRTRLLVELWTGPEATGPPDRTVRVWVTVRAPGG